MKKQLLFLAGLALPLLSWAEAKTVPYESSLYNDSEWTVVNANADSKTWHDDANNESIVYEYNSSSAADDWYISPAVHLEAGKTYVLQFSYMTSGSLREKFKVQIADGSSVDALTAGESLFDTGKNGVATSKNWIDEESSFTVEQAGDYYFGIQCYSASDKANLYVCDFAIKEYATTPADPTDLTAVVGENQQVTLQWTLPTTDTSGAVLTEALTGIEIYRDGALLTTVAGDATSYTYTEETPGSHTFCVVAVLGAQKSEESYDATVVVKAGPASLPWTSDFSSEDLFDLWTVQRGANSTMGSYAGWTYDTSAADALGLRARLYAYYKKQEDEWLISPSLKFEKAGSYSIKLTASSYQGGNSELKLYLGNGTEVSDFTQEIATLTNKLTVNKQDFEYTFNVSAPGTYYIAAQADYDRSNSWASEMYYIYSMEVAEYKVVPEQVADLAVAINGEQIDLTWTNPSKNNAGGDLSSLSRVEIYRDDELLATLTDATPGSAASWSDTNPNVGVNTYWVVAYNENGAAEGDPVKVASEKFGEVVAEIPYAADFREWTKVSDGNYLWETAKDTFVADEYKAKIVPGSGNTPNAWIISEKIKLEPNYVYDVEFYTFSDAMTGAYTVDFTSGESTSSDTQALLKTVSGSAESTKTPDYTYIILRSDADGKGTDGITDGEAAAVVSVPAGNRTFAFHANATGATVQIRNFTITENEIASVRNLQAVNGGYAIVNGQLSFSEAADVTVVDISGKTVLSARGAESVDLNGLAGGVYVFHAVVGGKPVVGKFVK